MLVFTKLITTSTTSNSQELTFGIEKETLTSSSTVTNSKPSDNSTPLPSDSTSPSGITKRKISKKRRTKPALKTTLFPHSKISTVTRKASKITKKAYTVTTTVSTLTTTFNMPLTTSPKEIEEYGEEKKEEEVDEENELEEPRREITVSTVIQPGNPTDSRKGGRTQWPGTESNTAGPRQPNPTVPNETTEDLKR